MLYNIKVGCWIWLDCGLWMVFVFCGLRCEKKEKVREEDTLNL